MDDKETFVLLGNPVAHSLSPLMHNAAYAAMGLAARYEALNILDLGAAVADIRRRGIRGASVTLPFKTAVMDHLDEVEADARLIGAVNTISNTGGRLVGSNTDAPGLIRDLKEGLAIRGRTFAVLGAGGAARAAVFAILQEGGHPVIFNRSGGKAATLAVEFGCPWAVAGELDGFRADVLINATPVGMFPHPEAFPLEARCLHQFTQVVDLTYRPLRTRLRLEAAAAGCAVSSGLGMFVHQGAEQIMRWTGMEPPRTLMRQVVLAALEAYEDD